MGRRYGGLTPQERDAARRERLLAAGMDLFGTVGYARTTIQAVCARARVTARNFYDHFDGLEDLLRAVYERVVAHGRSALLARLQEAAPSPEARMRRGAEAYLHAMLDDPRAARVQCVEVVGVSAALEARRRAVIHEYAELLKTHLRAMPRFRGVGESAAALVSLVLVAGMDELLIEHVTGGTYARPIPEVVAAMALLLGTDRTATVSRARGRAHGKRTRGDRQW